jgi:hypothetical protein
MDNTDGKLLVSAINLMQKNSSKRKSMGVASSKLWRKQSIYRETKRRGGNVEFTGIVISTLFFTWTLILSHRAAVYRGLRASTSIDQRVVAGNSLDAQLGRSVGSEVHLVRIYVHLYGRAVTCFQRPKLAASSCGCILVFLAKYCCAPKGDPRRRGALRDGHAWRANH